MAGLHRQLLYVTSFVFAGYYLLKRQDYMYAVRDHDMFGYMNSHPEDFPEKGNLSHCRNPLSSLYRFPWLILLMPMASGTLYILLIPTFLSVDQNPVESCI